MRLVLSYAFFTFCIGAFAQSSSSYNIVPLSPAASSLGSYGLLPLNLATGAMVTEVPLYTLKTNNLSIPIGLSYSSSGVKVNNISGDVGLNWVLQAGGAIIRMVRDQPDNGIFSQGNEMPYPQNTVTMNVELVKYIDAARAEGFDSERDLYAYNFLGQTGKFAFDRNQSPLFVPFRAMKLNISEEPFVDGQGQQHFGQTLIMTDEKGIKYYFNTKESTRRLPNICDGHDMVNTVGVTAYYLDMIEHPKGDQVVFEYELYSYSYTSGVTEEFTEQVNDTGNAYFCEACPLVGQKFCWKSTYINAVRLSRIRTFGHGDLTFHYSTRDDITAAYKLDRIDYILPDGEVTNSWELGYTYSSSNAQYLNFSSSSSEVMKRMFLTSLNHSGAAGEQGASYTYEYYDINGMAPRLSFSQDHWGYFNGKRNYYLVPEAEGLLKRNYSGRILFEGKGGDRSVDADYAKKGMLKSITHPTKGGSVIEYEGNTYRGSKTIPASSTQYSEVVQGINIKGMKEVIVSFYSAKAQDVVIDFRCRLSDGYTENDLDGHQNADFIVPGHDLIHITNGSELRRSFVFTKGHHQITIRAYGAAATAEIDFKIIESPDEVVDANIPTGGVRVVKITTTDPGTMKNKITRYHYASFDNLNSSSGKTFPVKPQYYKDGSRWFRCPNAREGFPCAEDFQNYWCDYLTLTSTSQVNLSYMNGNHITYSSVVVTDDEDFANGYEEHTFLVDYDHPGRIVWGEDIIGAPLSNFSWKNSFLESVKYYRNDGPGQFTLTSSIINNYIKDPRISGSIKNMVVKKKYDDPCQDELTEVCTGAVRSRKKDLYGCTISHNHSWGLIFFVDGWRCLTGNWKVVHTWYHPCYGEPEGTELFYYHSLANLDVLEYEDFAHWYYLESTIKTEYQNSGDPLVSEKIYSYENPAHLQSTKEVIINSNEDVVATRTTYPSDYNAALVSGLLDKNVIALPVKQEKLVNGQLADGGLNRYDDKGSVIEVLKYESDVLSDAPPHNANELIPPNYEIRESAKYNAISGNPNEVHYPDGTTATLIWGYNRKHLIAQVKNVTYDEAATQLGGLLTELETQVYDDATLRQKLDMMRGALAGKPIVTFIYRPGVGLVSKSDENNKTTHYEYDKLGRLKYISDDEKNIMKTYNYHYADK